MLLARRQDALDDVASGIRACSTVEVRTLAVDLTAEDAVTAITAATAGLEVGLVMYCAGADPNYEPFLSQPIEAAVAMVQRNCVVPMRAVPPLRRPRCGAGPRAASCCVSSGAGLVGAPNMVAYGATKAFDMVMAEALWAELHDQGVDVLGARPRRDRHPRAAPAAGASAVQLADPRRPDPGRGDGRGGGGRGASPTWPTARPGSPATTSARASSTSGPCPATTPCG